VAHHGGTGTLSAVLAAGKPSILLPQVKCQQDYGEMLMRERLATGVFAVDSLTPELLAGAIRDAVSDERVLGAAREWQRRVLADPGLPHAADLIEQHWQTIYG
jgi:sterol 3beta-glucosyltransferase